MNKEQLEIAKNKMIDWLKHPNELGEKPDDIEFFDILEIENLIYYIFKYKSYKISNNWLLGFSGAYTKESNKDNGYTFSEMKEFSEKTSREDVIKMIENIRKYWKEEEEALGFTAFALLSKNLFDKEEFLNKLEEDWKIEANIEGDSVVYNAGENIIAKISLMTAPIPNNEAEEYAKTNYLWKEAVSITSKHKAHIMVTIIGESKEYIKKGILHTKILSTLASFENTIGIFASGTVFKPEHYRNFSMIIKQNELPIHNWIYIGFYQTKKGLSAYTYGMFAFDKYEIEILNSEKSAEELHKLISNLVDYILSKNIVLKNNESIGFSESKSYTINISEGIAVNGDSVKLF